MANYWPGPLKLKTAQSDEIKNCLHLSKPARQPWLRKKLNESQKLKSELKKVG